MGARAVLEWHDSNGLRARFFKQWGSPAYQLPGIVDWLGMCADQGVTPTPEGYAEHAFTTDVDLIREPFPTHVPIPDDVEHVYTLTIGVSTGVYVTVTSLEQATGISHHRAGTDDLAELHLEAAHLLEDLAEQLLTARHGLDPQAADRLFPDPQAVTDAATRHRAHAVGHSHA